MGGDREYKSKILNINFSFAMCTVHIRIALTYAVKYKCKRSESIIADLHPNYFHI